METSNEFTLGSFSNQIVPLITRLKIISKEILSQKRKFSPTVILPPRIKQTVKENSQIKIPKKPGTTVGLEI